MTANNNEQGERKVILRRVDPANMMFVGLLDASDWEPRKAVAGESIVTQRAFLGATRNLTGNAFPEVGLVFPVSLLKGRSGKTRNGKQMRQHLNTIKATRKSERTALKTLTSAKARVL